MEWKHLRKRSSFDGNGEGWKRQNIKGFICVKTSKSLYCSKHRSTCRRMKNFYTDIERPTHPNCGVRTGTSEHCWCCSYLGVIIFLSHTSGCFYFLVYMKGVIHVFPTTTVCSLDCSRGWRCSFLMPLSVTFMSTIYWSPNLLARKVGNAIDKIEDDKHNCLQNNRIKVDKLKCAIFERVNGTHFFVASSVFGRTLVMCSTKHPTTAVILTLSIIAMKNIPFAIRA